MKMNALLDRLETFPMLGRSLHDLTDELRRLKLRVRDDTPAEVAVRVLLLEARVRSIAPASDVVAFLSGAELWARSHGLEAAACQVRLMWCRSVAFQDINALPTDVLHSTVEQAQALGTLEPQWRTTLATAGHPDAQRLLEEAIPLFPSPSCDLERLSAWMQLAAIRHDGGDVEGGLVFLKQALSIADAHDARDHITEINAVMAHLYLAQGQATRAVPHLERALALADDRDDALHVVTNATLLSALQVADAQWSNAEATANRLAVAAARRGNWLSLADAHITRSTCMMARGEVPSAIDHLVRESFRMQEFATQAAVNLIKGRLVEIRQTVGGAAFDSHFEVAVAREVNALHG
jgi:tetratricopeptide (TPR) repeat protein